MTTVTSTRRDAAALLWLVWASLLGTSLLWPDSGQATLLRVASSGTLVAVTWLHGAAGTRLARWVGLGMTFGFLGDVWALVPEGDLHVHRLIPVMVLFGLGHLAYILGFLRARRAVSNRSRMVVPIATFWLSVSVFAWLGTFRGSPASTGLRAAALAYSALLGGTTAAATILAAERKRYMPVAAGAILFLISDIVLGVQSFRGSFPHATELCWATYGPGQMLIVYGVAWAARGRT